MSSVGNKITHYTKENVEKMLSEYIKDISGLNYFERKQILVFIRDYRIAKNEAKLFKSNIEKILKDKGLELIKSID